MNSAAAVREIQVSRSEDCWRGQFFAMASPCEVLCAGVNADEARWLAKLAATEVWRIEDKFSRYLPDNIVANINAAAGAALTVDAETAQLLNFAETLHGLSGGKFDVTSGVLRRVWRFDGSDKLPDKAALAATLKLVGWQRVQWQAPVLRLLPGMEIDFGGIGKEYAVDRASALLREAGIDCCCLVNLGGDLAVAARAGSSARAWKVGIEAIDATSAKAAKMLTLESGALATSGDARRFLLSGGVRYSHILDARNGWPVTSAPRSVTVAADTCTQAGMLSTLAMLEGEDAEAFLEAQGVTFWCTRQA